MDAAATLQQLTGRQGSRRNIVYKNHLPEKTKQCPLVTKGYFVIGEAKEEGSVTTTQKVCWSKHTRKRTATALCLPHGLFPAHISNTTQPTLQMSILEL
jgi:hypothetical protein